MREFWRADMFPRVASRKSDAEQKELLKPVLLTCDAGPNTTHSVVCEGLTCSKLLRGTYCFSVTVNRTLSHIMV